MVKLTRMWTGKKEPTNPTKKEQHQDRKTKKGILNHIHDDDWDQQLREYYATESVQEQLQ